VADNRRCSGTTGKISKAEGCSVMGMIAVKEYKSLAEMQAGMLAARQRTMFAKPKPRPTLAAPVIRQIQRARDVPVPLPDVSTKDKATHEERIKGYLQDLNYKPFMREYIAKHAKRLGFDYDGVVGTSREGKVTLARQKIMWLVRKNYPQKSLPEIGRAFGDRDHTTVLHAVRKIEKMLAWGDPKVADLERWVGQ
jgi:hypothetical protein